ncbi:hypothetical protein COOONC_14950 [Cooperia oncophora]
MCQKRIPARRGSGLSKVPPEVRNICGIMNKSSYKASDLRYQLLKYLNRNNISLLSPYEWEETDRYKASKSIKADPNVYEKNVKTINRCTSELLKDYVPPTHTKEDG